MIQDDKIIRLFWMILGRCSLRNWSFVSCCWDAINVKINNSSEEMNRPLEDNTSIRTRFLEAWIHHPLSESHKKWVQLDVFEDILMANKKWSAGYANKKSCLIQHELHLNYVTTSNNKNGTQSHLDQSMKKVQEFFLFVLFRQIWSNFWGS